MNPPERWRKAPHFDRLRLGQTMYADSYPFGDVGRPHSNRHVHSQPPAKARPSRRSPAPPGMRVRTGRFAWTLTIGLPTDASTTGVTGTAGGAVPAPLPPDPPPPHPHRAAAPIIVTPRVINLIITFVPLLFLNGTHSKGKKYGCPMTLLARPIPLLLLPASTATKKKAGRTERPAFFPNERGITEALTALLTC